MALHEVEIASQPRLSGRKASRLAERMNILSNIVTRLGANSLTLDKLVEDTQEGPVAHNLYVVSLRDNPTPEEKDKVFQALCLHVPSDIPFRLQYNVVEYRATYYRPDGITTLKKETWYRDKGNLSPLSPIQRAKLAKFKKDHEEKSPSSQ